MSTYLDLYEKDGRYYASHTAARKHYEIIPTPGSEATLLVAPEIPGGATLLVHQGEAVHEPMHNGRIGFFGFEGGMPIVFRTDDEKITTLLCCGLEYLYPICSVHPGGK